MDFHLSNSTENLTKEQVGGKGFYLHQMVQDGLPIPEAAFLTTDLWAQYQKNPEQTTQKIKKDIIPQIIAYFKEQNGGVLPLVSVRSAGVLSMPGMMDTVLNVGVNQKFFKDALVGEVSADGDAPKGKSKSKTAKTTSKTTKVKKGADTAPTSETSEEFVADVYARFLTMYGQTVLGIDKAAFNKHKVNKSVADVEVQFENIYQKHGKSLPSQKPEEQILQCILAVFDSWNNPRAKLYRKLHKIPDDMGTAVVIQKMVFGNRNDNSATGVLFSRNPSNGKNQMTGEYLVNAQGEDVVSGSHTPKNLDGMEEEFPKAYEDLKRISGALETKYKQMQDIEFTIDNDTLYILQARTAKASPFAKLKMLMDMHRFKDITAADVLGNLTRQEYLDLNIRQVDQSYPVSPQGTGLPASMGAIAGRVVFGPSVKYHGEPTIFLAKETTPDDLEAIQLATGILTASGGVTSHAAVVARGMGKICIVGCSDLKVETKNGSESATIGGVSVKSGDWITLDANAGKVWVGKDVPIIDAQNTDMYRDLEDLVLEAFPEWTRVVSKVDDIVKSQKTCFLTYSLDDGDDEFMRTELGDATQYLNGVMDLTGKLDFLQKKYANQFLFADVSAEKVFLRKKRILINIAQCAPSDIEFGFSVFLGPYEKEHADDFKQVGLSVVGDKGLSFDPSNTKSDLVVTQQYDPKRAPERTAMSSRNALLGVLR